MKLPIRKGGFEFGEVRKNLKMMLKTVKIRERKGTGRNQSRSC